MLITGKTKLVGLFAQPASHSQSPLIHNMAFNRLGIDAVYLAFDINLQKKPQAIDTIKNLDMLGVNLSMPNKLIAKELVDEYSEVVSLVGAVNTIVLDNGKLMGYNTDGTGFIRSLDDLNYSIINETFIVLGLGGAALSIIAQAALDGAKEIYVFNRKGSNIQERLSILQKIEQTTNCCIHFYYLEDTAQLKKAIGVSSLLVNATNVGMGELEDKMPIPQNIFLSSTLCVVDIIYYPETTKLLQYAQSKGCQTSNGLSMLLHQASTAFELWTGQKMPVLEVKNKLEETRRNQQ